jgi:hypothetical protein
MVSQSFRVNSGFQCLSPLSVLLSNLAFSTTGSSVFLSKIALVFLAASHNLQEPASLKNTQLRRLHQLSPTRGGSDFVPAAPIRIQMVRQLGGHS